MTEHNIAEGQRYYDRDEDTVYRVFDVSEDHVVLVPFVPIERIDDAIDNDELLLLEDE